MRRLIAILFIILATSTMITAQVNRQPPKPRPTVAPRNNVDADTGGWVKFTSTQGAFSVLMPGTPKERTTTEPNEHGVDTSHFIRFEDTNIYLVGWVDYDPSFIFHKRIELTANRDSFIKGINATLISSRTVTLDGYDAIEFTAETPDRIFRSRVYMVGRRPYIIVIGHPKDAHDPVVVNRFFNSFKVRPS